MPKINIDWDPVGAQRDFFLDTDSKFLHLSGGYGSGKTTSLIYKTLQLSYLNRPWPGGLICPSFADYRRDVLPAMEDILYKHRIKYDYHGSEHKFRFPWSRGWLYIATAEKKLRGPNWGYAACNELTLMPIDRYREVIGRVRLKGCRAPQIVSSGTPEGIASEYYELFVERPFEGSRILYMDTRENAHNLESGYVDRIIATYPKQLIDAYLKGLWVNMSGNRFYYSYDPAFNEDKTVLPNFDYTFHCSMDFNVDPFCAAIWQQRGHKMIAVDEIALEYGEGYKTTNMIDALISRGYTPNNTIIYPDPAGASRSTKGDSDVKILRQAGYEVRVKSAAPKFRERQINGNNLFEKGYIMVNPERCPRMKKDLLAVEQDPITMEKSKSNPRLTHFSDGMDYMLDILYPFSGHRARVTQTRIR
jgi:hypothetical protein